MLQIKILQLDTRLLYVPTNIKKLTIDAKKHLQYVESFGENPVLPVYVYKDADIIRYYIQIFNIADLQLIIF